MPKWEISGCGIVSVRAVGMVIVETFGVIERMALYWVQKYICEFGGDPGQVIV